MNDIVQAVFGIFIGVSVCFFVVEAYLRRRRR